MVQTPRLLNRNKSIPTHVRSASLPFRQEASILQERLQQILVFEFHQDGERELRSTTLRELYNYVLSAITHKRERSNSLARLPASTETSTAEGIENSNITNQEIKITSVPYRERLGGYLHPRDMRRLVTPFSATNEPVLMVRRHVMLLNFDPLRAIVLRDRLLLLVPDGSDAILLQLEKRLRGGLRELEDLVFGSIHGSATCNPENNQTAFSEEANQTVSDQNIPTIPEGKTAESLGVPLPSEKTRRIDEWEDIDDRTFIELPFELLAVDVVLDSVVSLLTTDASKLCKDVERIILSITMDTKAPKKYEKLRVFKDKVKETESRIKGFERALNQILDEDEDMALMNLSRLITHPERFVLPASQDILSAESDEPELILESYLQQAFCASNSLELLTSKIATTEELVEIRLDTIPNRLLFATTILTLIISFLAACSLFGSIFGCNLWNGPEESPIAFSNIWIGTFSSAATLFTFVF